MKTVVEILVAARALIEKPENWCHGGSGGRRHCAVSAIWAITAVYALRAGPAIDALCAVVHGGNMTRYNDTHSHVDVLAVFDRAIAAEKCKRGIDDKVARQVQDLLAKAVASAAVTEPVA